jgi:salicylate hydroxylase
VLKYWGLEPTLSPNASNPKCANLISWKGVLLSSLDFATSAAKYPGTCYWDFHRADLHRVLIDRAVGLGATMECNARVIDVKCDTDRNTETVVLADGREQTADLVIGADGIHSSMREVLVGQKQPPKRTGDLAYRLLLETKKLMRDPDLAPFVTTKEVNYWIGPGAHVGKFGFRAFLFIFILINLLVSHLYITR